MRIWLLLCLNIFLFGCMIDGGVNEITKDHQDREWALITFDNENYIQFPDERIKKIKDTIEVHPYGKVVRETFQWMTSNAEKSINSIYTLRHRRFQDTIFVGSNIEYYLDKEMYKTIRDFKARITYSKRIKKNGLPGRECKYSVLEGEFEFTDRIFVSGKDEFLLSVMTPNINHGNKSILKFLESLQLIILKD